MGGILFREYCFGEENSLSFTANSVSSAKGSVSSLWHTNNRLRGTHWARSPELSEPQKTHWVRCLKPYSPKPYSVRANFWEGDEDSNFSVFRVRRFTESPEPLHWIAFPVGNPYQTPHSLNCSPPFSLKTPFFSLKSASSHPLPKNGVWIRPVSENGLVEPESSYRPRKKKSLIWLKRD